MQSRQNTGVTSWKYSTTLWEAAFQMIRVEPNSWSRQNSTIVCLDGTLKKKFSPNLLVKIYSLSAS